MERPLKHHRRETPLRERLMRTRRAPFCAARRPARLHALVFASVSAWFPALVCAQTNFAPNAPETDGRNIGIATVIIGVIVLVAVVLLTVWGRAILIRFDRRRKYREAALMDELPSVDERLMSELTTLNVVLLRGSVPAYYEKVVSLMSRLLQSRKLMDAPSKDSAVMLQSLRASGADPVFIDCAESILHRCDDVLVRNETPLQAAHEKIAKDLRMLVTMRPHSAYSRREKTPEGASH